MSEGADEGWTCVALVGDGRGKLPKVPQASGISCSHPKPLGMKARSTWDSLVEEV